VAHGGAGDTLPHAALHQRQPHAQHRGAAERGIDNRCFNRTPATLPSPDGIDEMRFLTSNAPSEYGRTSGAVLAANTISGTNIFHGNAYVLVRNDALNANTFFHKLANPQQPRGRDRYYQVGGSFGGPVWIPHLYNGHDRTFFFVNYDRTLVKKSEHSERYIPDAQKRAGDFSGAQPVNAWWNHNSAVPKQPGYRHDPAPRRFWP